MEIRGKEPVEVMCDICRTPVESVYFDMENDKSGHKSCLKLNKVEENTKFQNKSLKIRDLDKVKKRKWVETDTNKYNPLKRSKYRNERCYCGSAKKVKKCCGLNEFVAPEFLPIINSFIQVLEGKLPKFTFQGRLNKFAESQGKKKLQETKDAVLEQAE